MEELQNWVFHYNPYTKKYGATTREHYAELFNNNSSKNVVYSSEQKTLESLIVKYKGDISKIKNLK